MSSIISIMERYASSTNGKLGIGYKNLKTGEEHYIRGDESFPAASTFKVPLLITLFQMASVGEISLDEVYSLCESDISPGSGVLACLKPGLTMRVIDYATLMMIVSDNTATDIIFRMVGVDRIKQQIEAMGLSRTRAELSCKDLIMKLFSAPEGISFEKALEGYEAGIYKKNHELYTDTLAPNDVSSPKDMVKMFTLLESGSIVSAEASRQMLGIMEKCQTNSRIPYWLPGEGVNKAVIAHKTGTLPGVANDSGIVRTDSEAYILSLFYNGYEIPGADCQQKNEQLLAELSREIFFAMHQG